MEPSFRNRAIFVVAAVLAAVWLLAAVPVAQGQQDSDLQEWLRLPFSEDVTHSPTQGWMATEVVQEGHSHYGQDWSLGCGTPMLALADGVVLEPSRSAYRLDPAGWGLALWIDVNLSEGGVGYHYAHLSEILVEPGEYVRKGQVIATSGGKKGELNSGFSTGCHAHIGVFNKHPDEFVGWYDGWVDPGEYLGTIQPTSQLESEGFFGRLSTVGWIVLIGAAIMLAVAVKKLAGSTSPDQVLVWVADHEHELRSANKRGCLSASRMLGYLLLAIGATVVWNIPVFRGYFEQLIEAAVLWLSGTTQLENWWLLASAAIVIIANRAYRRVMMSQRFWRWKRRLGWKYSVLLYAVTAIVLVVSGQKLLGGTRAYSHVMLDRDEVTYAMVYGGLGGWGTLGLAHTPEQAVMAAANYAQRVDDWNGGKPVIPVVNVNVDSLTLFELNELIGLCDAGNCIVMIDIAGNRDIEGTIRKWTPAGQHVWFDIDVEHHGRPMTAQQLNEAAELFFSLRREEGFAEPAIFGFYDFQSPGWVQPAEDIRWSYPNGEVAVFFDGFGSVAEKNAGTERTLDEYDAAERGIYGVMEFSSRWADRYDNGVEPREYFEEFEPLIMIAQ